MILKLSPCLSTGFVSTNSELATWGKSWINPAWIFTPVWDQSLWFSFFEMGTEKENVLPSPSTESAQTRPPCA
jgi:hypothetical protein